MNNSILSNLHCFKGIPLLKNIYFERFLILNLLLQFLVTCRLINSTFNCSQVILVHIIDIWFINVIPSLIFLYAFLRENFPFRGHWASILHFFYFFPLTGCLWQIRAWSNQQTVLFKSLSHTSSQYSNRMICFLLHLCFCLCRRLLIVVFLTLNLFSFLLHILVKSVD